MAYVRIGEDDSMLGSFGCGPGCGCEDCWKTAAALSGFAERYEQDQADAPPPSAIPLLRVRPIAPELSGWSRLAEPAPAPARACDNRSVPERPPLRPLTAAKVSCPRPGDFEVLAKAVRRAVEMLDNTIGELVNARAGVCAGGAPTWPLLGDITADWLRNRLGVCIDDMRVWTAGTFVNRSVAEVIRRLVRVRNLIGTNQLRYSCTSPDCEPGVWAFVRAHDADGKCLPGTPMMLVRLCSRFWNAAPGVDPAVHAEFQAQTIIHEASHLTHCTEDKAGSTIGVAECLAQFVAATNGSPLDPTFQAVCAVTDRCAPAGAPVGGFGLGAAGWIRGTTFHPEKAIRLRGRLAGRAALTAKRFAARAAGQLGQPLPSAGTATGQPRPKPPYLRYFNLDGFEWNKHSLTPRLRSLVGYLAKMVESSLPSAQPIGTIHLVGHTDSSGPESYNVGLGNRRAQAVADELAKFKGIASRVAIVVDPSPGKTKPVADNRTKEGRVANRRVEVFVTSGAVSPTTSPREPRDWRKAAEDAARQIEEEAERRRQEQIYNRPVPGAPPGKSLRAWLGERLKRLPDWLRTKIRDAILNGACALLESLLAQAVGRLSDKEKEDLRKICLEQAKRPAR